MSLVPDTIPWFQPEIVGQELDRLKDVLGRNFLNDGPLTREFENQIASIVGVRHCVAVTSGTVAISLALMALGIGHGDEVLVPDLTFIATANAVRMTGADVKLIDIELNRFAIDPTKLESSIGPRTRAIVSVDVNGRGANYDFLEPFCQSNGLFLITDSAEALGSYYGNKPLGSFGQAACFSFSPNKTITTGQGGIVATNDKNIYGRLVELKDHGRAKRGTGGDDIHSSLGFNFKFTDLQAAIGLAQLNAFEGRKRQAQSRDSWYRSALSGIEGVTLCDMTSQAGELRQWMDILSNRKECIRQALTANGIGHRAFWFPLHTQNPYVSQKGCFQSANTISAMGLWLPSHFSLTQHDVQRTADVIRTALHG